MPVWNPDLPDPIDYLGAVDRRARQPGVRQRVQGAVGAVPGRRGRGQPFRWDLAEGAKGVQLAGLALQSSAQGRRVSVPPLVTLMTAMIALPGRGRAGHGSRPRLGGVLPAAASAASTPPRTWRAPTAASTGTSTLAFREHLWAYGFGVAEAMDTAQRGMGLSFDQAGELITRSAARAAPARRGDRQRRRHRPAAAGPALAATIIAPPTSSSCSLVQCGRLAGDPDGEPGAGRQRPVGRRLPGRLRQVLRPADQPVLLHWLGEAFDPALRGYWGSADFSAAADTVLELIRAGRRHGRGHQAVGADAGFEISAAAAAAARRPAVHRRRLPLRRADPAAMQAGHSDALLGAFAAVTAPAAAALHALDRRRPGRLRRRHRPDRGAQPADLRAADVHYKVGVAFLAWLNGLQPHFVMLGRMQRAAVGRAPGQRSSSWPPRRGRC